MIRSGMKGAARSGLFAGFVSLLERFDSGALHLLRVLTYHRVDEPDARPHLYPNLISATPDSFARQMEFLARNYRVLSVFELQEAWRTDKRLPPRSVMITFDDAYQDFAEHAWPILKSLHLPVTLFVPTAYPGCPERLFWWDRLHAAIRQTDRREPLESPAGRLEFGSEETRYRAVRQLADHIKTLPHSQALQAVDAVCADVGEPPVDNAVLDWDALLRLHDEGVTLGAHTRTHPLLNRLTLDEAAEEAAGSLDDLQQRIGNVPPILAYPAGGCSAEIAERLHGAGFSLAFTTCRGVNDLRTANPLLLRRINVGRNTSDAALRAQLLPWSVHLNRWLH